MTAYPVTIDVLDLRRIRDHLLEARAGMKAWADDLAAGVAPFAESIAASAARADAAIAFVDSLDAIRRASAPAPLAAERSPMRLRMTCPACGSTDIAGVNCDGWWNEASQEWIASEPEICICDDCGEEFEQPREVEIMENKEAA